MADAPAQPLMFENVVVHPAAGVLSNDYTFRIRYLGSDLVSVIRFSTRADTNLADLHRRIGAHVTETVQSKLAEARQAIGDPGATITLDFDFECLPVRASETDAGVSGTDN